MKKPKKLTKRHYDIMRGIARGADIWGLREAYICREIQAYNPDLIDIVDAMEQPPGECRQPYFGAILTDYGRTVLAIREANPGAVKAGTAGGSR
jgi:hypothetical protein